MVIFEKEMECEISFRMAIFTSWVFSSNQCEVRGKYHCNIKRLFSYFSPYSQHILKYTLN